MHKNEVVFHVTKNKLTNSRGIVIKIPAKSGLLLFANHVEPDNISTTNYKTIKKCIKRLSIYKNNYIFLYIIYYFSFILGSH